MTFALLAVLLVGVWSILPFLAQKTLQKVLLDQGFQTVEIGSVELKWFKGEVSLQQVRLQNQNAQILSFSDLKVDLSWAALWQKKWLIQDLVLTQLRLTVDRRNPESVQILGFPLVPAPDNTADSTSGFFQDWGFGVQSLSLNSAEVTLLAPEKSEVVHLKEVHLSNVLSWHPSGETLLSMELSHPQLAFSVHAKGQPFASAKTISGQLDLKGFDLLSITPYLPTALSNLSGQLSGVVDLQLDALQDEIALEWHAHLDLVDAQFKMHDLTFKNQRLDWVGQGESHIDLAQSSLSSLNAKGHLDNHQLTLQAEDAEQPMLSLQLLQTDWQITDLKQVKLSTIVLDKLALQPVSTPVSPDLGVAESIIVDSIQFTSPSDLEVGQVAGEKWQLNLSLNEQQQPQAWLDSVDWIMAQLVSETNKMDVKKTDAETPATPSENAAFAFSLKGFELKQSEFSLTLHSVTPPLQKTLLIETMRLGVLDTRQPNQLTELNLDAKIDEYSEIALTGKAAPLSQPLNTELNLELKGLDLHSFSPLIQDSLGYRIQNGSLSGQSKIALAQNQLTSEHDLTLNGFELGDVENVSPAFSTLKIGLNLLRDKNDQIQLKVPVNGNITAPNFELASVINKALLSTLKGGTKTYLALTLQPYGALYLAADYAYKKLGQVVLQPVEFKIGQAVWLDAMPDYLHKVAEMLLNKPQLTLKVCGFYNEQDQRHWQEKGLKDAALTEKLLTLANRRQNQVKAWLIEHESIAVDQLTTCQPAFEPLSETGVLLSM